MKKAIVIFLALFGSSLQMQTVDPWLEQTKTVDPPPDQLKSVGIMQSFENKVNPSPKIIRYDRGSIATESLNLDQESTNHVILDTPEFHAVITPEVRQLASIFEKYGFEIRIVGGAVRDLLEGKKPHDLDLATVATPTEIKEMFEKEEIRMITTLKGNISKDSEHTVEQFSKDWKIDAAHRDLTINAMYLDFKGTLYDYFNGHEDLKARRVIFIGNPDTRVKDDSRRILRYFKYVQKLIHYSDAVRDFHDE